MKFCSTHCHNKLWLAEWWGLSLTKTSQDHLQCMEKLQHCYNISNKNIEMWRDLSIIFIISVNKDWPYSPLLCAYGIKELINLALCKVVNSGHFLPSFFLVPTGKETFFFQGLNSYQEFISINTLILCLAQESPALIIMV